MTWGKPGAQALAGLLAVCATVLSSGAVAQAYPNRTITVIVAFGAAGVTDSMGRLVAKNLSERLKVPVIVENRPGANQIIGIQQLKSRPADGYTLYVGTGSSLAQNPGIRNDLPYNEAEYGAHSTMTAIFGRMATYSGKVCHWDDAQMRPQHVPQSRPLGLAARSANRIDSWLKPGPPSSPTPTWTRSTRP